MSDKRIIIHDLLSYYNFNSEDLMNIIISHKIDYSTNSNGIFVNLSLLSDDIIDMIYNKLQEYIQTIKSKKQSTLSTKKNNSVNKISEFKPHPDKIHLDEIQNKLIELSKVCVQI